MGARPMRRTIQEQIEDRIADFVLDHSDDHQLAARLDKDGNIEVVSATPTKTDTPTETSED